MSINIYSCENLTVNQQKWLQHYNKLILKASARKNNEYIEVHHIIPRCMRRN